ncbi:hypothetical protein HDU98_008247 [Podochytrium sp. JEL0797]|nr:hypothetical protein HDU98_008247 [Podochytrium sp. JEL0797]
MAVVSHFSQAMAHHSAGLMREALEEFKLVYAAAPVDEPESWHYLGNRAARQDHPDSAGTARQYCKVVSLCAKVTSAELASRIIIDFAPNQKPIFATVREYFATPDSILSYAKVGLHEWQEFPD